MLNETEFAKIATEIVSNNIHGIFNGVVKMLGDIKDSIKVKCMSSFTNYVTNMITVRSYTKTLIYHDTPRFIPEFYEPLDLNNSYSTIENASFNDIVKMGHPVIITGIGGSGKSMLLKHLLLQCIEDGKYIPIYIELRAMESSDLLLQDFIANELQLNHVDIPHDFLKYAIENGGFALFLDGLDELSQGRYSTLSLQIQKLADLNTRNIYIITSRFGDNFISWRSFMQLSISPMTYDKAISLVNRLNVNVELKDGFLRNLDRDRFKEYESFASNPLLLSFMLITFYDTANIEPLLHNFYASAFQALYNRHDAISKESFKRPTLSGLRIDKVEDLMAAFSVITYLQERMSFSEQTMREYLDQASILSHLVINTDDVLTDFVRAYCLFIKDGLDYRFTHRSFQEYFSAIYLLSAPSAKQKDICMQFAKRISLDTTISLAFGMNRYLIEELLIIPWLKKIMKLIADQEVPSPATLMDVLNALYEEIQISENSGLIFLKTVHIKNSERFLNSGILRFIESNYSSELKGFEPEYFISKNLSRDNFNTLNKIASDGIIPIHRVLGNQDALEIVFHHSLYTKRIAALSMLLKRMEQEHKKTFDIIELLVESSLISEVSDPLEDFKRKRKLNKGSK